MNLKGLAKEYDEEEDPARRGMVARTLVNKILEGPANSETSVIGVGPVSLDVAMAREHGWSEQQIERSWAALESVSLAESEISRLRRPELFEDDGDGNEVFVGDQESEKEVACTICGAEFGHYSEAPYYEEGGVATNVKRLMSKTGVHAGYLMNSGADGEPEIICENCGFGRGL